MLRKGSGFDLQDLILSVGYLREEEARFYSCEVICGLEHLHAMGIVHLDLKLKNVLLADSGHVFITDFDCAWEKMRRLHFIVWHFFKAPEVGSEIVITAKVDVWSLGDLLNALIPPRHFF